MIKRVQKMRTRTMRCSIDEETAYLYQQTERRMGILSYAYALTAFVGLC